MAVEVTKPVESATPNPIPAGGVQDAGATKVDTSSVASTQTAAPTPPEKAAPKPNEPPGTTKIVPDKYDLKLPEGSPLSAAALERIRTQSKAEGLSNEQAQAVVDRELGAITSYVESERAAFEQRKSEWVGQIQSDKELGGEKFNENIELAKRVVTKFGSESLLKTLNDTGLGNHPELVRLLARVGKSMSNDTLHISKTPMEPTKKRPEDIFYPSASPK